MNDRDGILFDLCMALRKVPPGHPARPRQAPVPPDDLAEKIVAEAIVEHLELCGWRLEHVRRRNNCPRRLHLRKA